MTSSFWPQKAYMDRLHKAFKENNADPEFRKLFTSRKDDAIFNLAARFVRANSTPVLAFRKLLEGSLSDCGLSANIEEVFANSPLIVTAKDPNMVRVYLNVRVKTLSEEAIKHCCWCMHWETLDPFYDDYRVALSDPRRAVAWNTTRRAWVKIKKFEEMTIGKALGRYTNIGKHLSENQILQLTTTIEEQRKPMKLIFAEKPEHYMEMYATGPSSCMSNSHAKSNGWDTTLYKGGYHPTSFYHFHPYLKGVYATQRNAVVARTVLHQKENGRWYFGRIYAASPKHTEKFQQSLIECGYVCLDETNYEKDRWWDKVKFQRSVEFNIPGVEALGHWHCPMPYFDTIGNEIFVQFNKGTFHVIMGHAKPNVSNLMQTGIVREDQLSSRSCSLAACNRVRPANYRWVESIDGKCFCTGDCAVGAGYVAARTVGGHNSYIPIADAVVDATNGHRYTTIEAANIHGCLPYITDLDDELDEETFTSQGVIIQLQDEKYIRLEPNAFNIAIRAGLVKETHDRYKTDENVFKAIGQKEKLNVALKIQKVVELDDNDVMFAA